MIYLKEANLVDYEQEFIANNKIPYFENGFGNSYFGVSKFEFLDRSLPKMIEESKGINLGEGRVPQTIFYLWDDDVIVGMFKIRHYLNEGLRKAGGHIGYGIIEEYRNKGYGKEGLRLCIEKCKEIIEEDEIYLFAYKFNKASLKVQVANGAYFVYEDDEIIHMRIKI